MSPRRVVQRGERIAEAAALAYVAKWHGIEADDVHAITVNDDVGDVASITLTMFVDVRDLHGTIAGPDAPIDLTVAPERMTDCGEDLGPAPDLGKICDLHGYDCAPLPGGDCVVSSGPDAPIPLVPALDPHDLFLCGATHEGTRGRRRCALETGHPMPHAFTLKS